jgi:hypothetical protein
MAMTVARAPSPLNEGEQVFVDLALHAARRDALGVLTAPVVAETSDHV